MANEITLTLALQAIKNGARVTYPAETLKVDMAGTNMTSNVQTVNDTTTAVALGGVDAPGFILFKNLSAITGNNIQVGLNTPVSGDAFAVLGPGQACLVACQQTTIYAIAATACDMQVIAVDL